ncbi:hypothetical protein L249_8521 [Ophiocordyceps polyrhachis-furcata BCC 54312]|uniref:Uncharacterized protein n=1 Tax=Ophiocordyceps polyrhachis-furcata BCC 54312 TaxID=1330021 RepID=A0A367L757_9HYPO|nr:hypothetical protein L249_8521 [Ophiocordyceps polyrhachis-furcata BCC 54312]
MLLIEMISACAMRRYHFFFLPTDRPPLFASLPPFIHPSIHRSSLPLSISPSPPPQNQSRQPFALPPFPPLVRRPQDKVEAGAAPLDRQSGRGFASLLPTWRELLTLVSTIKNVPVMIPMPLSSYARLTVPD